MPAIWRIAFLLGLGIPSLVAGQSSPVRFAAALDTGEVFHLQLETSNGGNLPACKIALRKPGAPQSIWKDIDSSSLVHFQGSFPLTVEIIPEDPGFRPTTLTLIQPKPEGYKVLILANDERIDPVSITGSLNPTAISKAPYSIEVISRKRIESMAAQSVDAVLQNQSNIRVSQDAILGSGLQLQGMGGADVKVLIDGVPMVGRLNGNIDLSQIPTNQVERIEIIEGPMSVIYGSDAIGGLINIISKRPQQQQKNLNLHSYIDGAGWRNLDANAQWSRGPWGASAFAGRHFSYGVDLDPSTRMMDWRPKTKFFAGGQLQHRGNRSEHQFKTQFFHEKLTDRSNAESNLSTVNGYTNYFYTQRLDFSQNSLIHLNSRNDFQWQNSLNFYQRDKVSFWRNLVSGEQKLTGANEQDTTYNQQFNSRGIWGSRQQRALNWMLGYEANGETLQSLRVKGLRPLISISAFASLEWRIAPWWQLRPAARWSLNNQFGELTSFSDQWRWAPCVPSIQSKWQLSEHLTLRASAARAFRAPSLKELYFLFVDINHNIHGNAQLQPEWSNNYTGTLEYRHSLNADHGAIFKANAFANFVENRIELALLDARYNYYQYINIGKLETRGITPQLEYFAPRWNSRISSTWVRSWVQIDSSGQKQGWNSLQAVWNAEYKFPKQSSSVNVYARFSGKQQGFYTTGSTYSIDPFTLLDVIWAKTVPLTWSRLTGSILQWQAGCNNALGIQRIGSAGLLSTPHSAASQNLNISPGRTLFMAIKVTL